MWAWLYIALFCVSFIFVLREWMPTRLSSLRVATTIRSSSGTLMMVCVTEQPNMLNRLVLLINAHPVKPKHFPLSPSAASEHARSDTRQEIRCIRRLGHLLASPHIPVGMYSFRNPAHLPTLTPATWVLGFLVLLFQLIHPHITGISLVGQIYVPCRSVCD